MIMHTDDIPWWEAPIPRRWHRCRPQSWIDVPGGLVERCACGGIRSRGSGWFEKNSRSHDE